MTQKNNPGGRSFLLKLLLAIFIVTIVVSIIWVTSLVFDTYFANTEDIAKIENIFIDINNDGFMDYIRYAEVIINTGNFTAGP